MLPARVVIVDFTTGRTTGGHQEDYLRALEAACARWEATVLAPYRDGCAKAGRAAAYRQEFRLMSKFARGRDGRPSIVVVHTPEFRDFIVFWLLSVTRPKRSAPVGVFVLRRSAEGIVGARNLKARLLERLIPRLIERRLLHPASDSLLALDHWRSPTSGASGTLLSIPRPVEASATGLRRDDGPVIGLVGRLRLEKGARDYDSVIRVALASFADASVRVQLGDDLGGEEREIVEQLRQRWQNHPRVLLVPGHLPPADYSALIASMDIVVLPYEPETYGSGTSGVLSDVLSMNKTALAAPIPWAMNAFASHPRVVWLSGTGDDALAEGLREAAQRAREARDRDVHLHDDTFASDWEAAIEAAERLLNARSGRHH